MRLCWLFLAVLLALPASAQVVNNSATLQSQGLFPFALPPFDDNPGPTDLSWMNEKPAGATGFVSVQGENFVDGAGRPIRFWGVNLNFSGLFPDKQQAPRIAGRLAKFGFNAVRVHHYEGYAAPNGLWKVAATGSTRLKIPREVDPDQLDRLDYFLAQLIQRGIYIDFNLHVARKLQEAEGFPNANQLPEKDKGIAYFDPKVAQEAKNFAQLILTHVNPYTGRAYKDEPGVCAVEVANENSILALWQDGSLSKLPDNYASVLRDRWNDYLRRQYASDVSLRASWTELNQALSKEDLLAVQPPPGAAFNPGPPPAVDPGAPTILPSPGVISPDAPAVAPTDPNANANGFPPPPAPDAPPIIVAPPIPQVNIAAVASLQKFFLALAGGSTGKLLLDDLGGPTVDGFVQPGLTVQMNQPGSVSWAFQVNRDGLPLVDGQPYTVSFWARAEVPRQISVNAWQDQKPFRSLGFTGYAPLTTEWKQFSFTFRPVGIDSARGRLAFNFGNVPGTVQLGSISLRQGGRIAMPDDSMIRGSVPLLEFKNTPILAARRDFVRFLGELEGANVTEMRRFLKQDVGVKVPIWNTQAQFGGWGGVLREEQSDVIDMHAYWKHPDFAGGGWSTTNWRVEDASMTASAGSDPLSAYALGRVRGKPFVVSEWNSGQPNDYGAESLPMIAAYGAAQGWAGIWVFDYHSAGDYNRDRIDGFFSIDSNPVKMATAVLGALAFRRPFAGELGDIPLTTERAALRMPRETAWSEAANVGGQPTFAPYVKSWNASGAHRTSSLEASAGVELTTGQFAMPSVADLADRRVYELAGGRLEWDSKLSLWTCNTARSKLLAGFGGGREVRLGEMRLWLNRPGQYVAGGLTSLDNQPIPDARRMLLVLTGRAENIGMGFNADRSSVGNNWGSGPVYAEGIDCTVRLATSAGYARVWALDQLGQRREIVPSALRNGILKFQVTPAWQTLWYEIEQS